MLIFLLRVSNLSASDFLSIFRRCLLIFEGYFGIRAAVFRAQRQQVDYALKIMTYDRIDLYEQEYGTLLKLESHPNVIKVHGVIKLDKFDKKIEEQLKELSCDEISSLRYYN